MIRRLIILLLIVGCVFGDTIVYKRLLLGEWEDETLKKVTVDKIEDGAVWYSQKQLFSTITETISCNKIIQILNKPLSSFPISKNLKNLSFINIPP